MLLSDTGTAVSTKINPSTYLLYLNSSFHGDEIVISSISNSRENSKPEPGIPLE